MASHETPRSDGRIRRAWPECHDQGDDESGAAQADSIRDTSGRWTRRERRARTRGRCRRGTPSRARLYAGCPSPTGGCSVSRRPRNSASPLRCGSCRCRPGGFQAGGDGGDRSHGIPRPRLEPTDRVGPRSDWTPTGTRSSCLIRALVAELLLDAHEGPMTLTIGVRRTAVGAFHAHAWLARRGSRAGRRDRPTGTCRSPAGRGCALAAGGAASGSYTSLRDSIGSAASIRGVRALRVQSDALLDSRRRRQRPRVRRVCDGSSAVVCRRLERSDVPLASRFLVSIRVPSSDGSSYVGSGQRRRVPGGGRRPADHMPARR